MHFELSTPDSWWSLDLTFNLNILNLFALPIIIGLVIITSCFCFIGFLETSMFIMFIHLHFSNKSIYTYDLYDQYFFTRPFQVQLDEIRLI